jgi:hypothetical protein
VKIDDLDIKCVTVTPPKTDPPLLVDPNAVFAFPIAFQSRQLIRTWNGKVLEVSSRNQAAASSAHVPEGREEGAFTRGPSARCLCLSYLIDFKRGSKFWLPEATVIKSWLQQV